MDFFPDIFESEPASPSGAGTGAVPQQTMESPQHLHETMNQLSQSSDFHDFGNTGVGSGIPYQDPNLIFNNNMQISAYTPCPNPLPGQLLHQPLHQSLYQSQYQLPYQSQYQLPYQPQYQPLGGQHQANQQQQPYELFPQQQVYNPELQVPQPQMPQALPLPAHSFPPLLPEAPLPAMAQSPTLASVIPKALNKKAATQTRRARKESVRLQRSQNGVADLRPSQLRPPPQPEEISPPKQRVTQLSPNSCCGCKTDHKPCHLEPGASQCTNCQRAQRICAFPIDARSIKPKGAAAAWNVLNLLRADYTPDSAPEQNTIRDAILEMLVEPVKDAQVIIKSLRQQNADAFWGQYLEVEFYEFKNVAAPLQQGRPKKDVMAEVQAGVKEAKQAYCAKLLEVARQVARLYTDLRAGSLGQEQAEGQINQAIQDAIGPRRLVATRVRVSIEDPTFTTYEQSLSPPGPAPLGGQVPPQQLLAPAGDAANPVVPAPAQELLPPAEDAVNPMVPAPDQLPLPSVEDVVNPMVAVEAAADASEPLLASALEEFSLFLAEGRSST